MVTINDSQDHWSNDNNLPILAWDPHGRHGGEDDTTPIGAEFLFAGEAGLKPGMPVYRSTGADGEDTVNKADTNGGSANAHRLYGVVGLDKEQIDDCTETYDSGDKVPILPFHAFLGAIMRNIILLDPNAAIDPDTPLGTGADGFDVITEATIATGGTVDGFNTSATAVGQFGASGMYIYNREFMKTKYGQADPGGDTRVVAYVVRA